MRMSKKHALSLAEVKKILARAPKESRASVVCSLVGHSKIVTGCFGYVHCARCDAQIGDRLASIFDLAQHVIVGHGCRDCRKNFKALDWRSTFMAPNPFAKRDHAKATK